MDKTTFFLTPQGGIIFSHVDWGQVVIELIGSFMVALVAGTIAGYLAGVISGRHVVGYTMRRQLLFRDLPHLSAVLEILTQEQVRPDVNKRYTNRAEREKFVRDNPGSEVSVWEDSHGWTQARGAYGFWRREFIDQVNSLLAPESVKVAKGIREFKTTHFSDLALYDSIISDIRKILEKERGEIES